MKKVVWLLALVFLLVGSLAQAKLLGIKQYMGYPDIIYNNTGNIKYDPDGDINDDNVLDTVDIPILGVSEFQYNFVLDADDLKIAYSDDSNDVDYLSGADYLTDMKVYLNVDTSGNLIEGYMVEQVVNGTVTVKDHTYSAGDVILAGEVVAFGYDKLYDSVNDVYVGGFDFLVSRDTLTGELIDDDIWPDEYPVGLFAIAEEIGDWDGTFASEFYLTKVKGDKAPVPEPATMLLVGAGLLGIGFVGRRHLKK